MSFIRRFPAVLWIAVYVGSLLILNGAHGTLDPLQLWLGIGLVVLACAVGLYLAFGPWPDDRPRPRGMFWFVGVVVAFYLITGTAGWILDGPEVGIATFLAGLIPLTAAGIWVASVRRATQPTEEGLVDATAEDHEDPVPAIGADDRRPLGDTPEAHDEITPHDLPKDHPGRKAAEAQAEGPGARVRR
jgi:hypothetical protein